MLILKNLYNKQSDYKKYMILSKPRTGSTLLASMLSAHTNIQGRGELLGQLRGKDPQTVLDDLFQPQKAAIKAVGFKMHYNHPVDGDVERTWDILRQCENLHIIHLARKNILRFCVSEKITQKLKLFELDTARKRPSLKDRRVTVTATELKHLIYMGNKHYQAYGEMFASHPMIEVEYEDLVNNPATEFQRITAFLDLPQQQPVIKTVAMNPEPLADLIANYAELRAEFANTQWAWMFE